MDGQLLSDPGYAFVLRRAHSPSNISFDNLAVTTYRIAPSSTLVEKVVGMENLHNFLGRGGNRWLLS